MEYIQAAIRGNWVFVQDKSYVQACYCRYGDDVLSTMDRY